MVRTPTRASPVFSMYKRRFSFAKNDVRLAAALVELSLLRRGSGTPAGAGEPLSPSEQNAREDAGRGETIGSEDGTPPS